MKDIERNKRDVDKDENHKEDDSTYDYLNNYHSIRKRNVAEADNDLKNFMDYVLPSSLYYNFFYLQFLIKRMGK